jgi:hypothetical protein
MLGLRFGVVMYALGSFDKPGRARMPCRAPELLYESSSGAILTTGPYFSWSSLIVNGAFPFIVASAYKKWEAANDFGPGNLLKGWR